MTTTEHDLEGLDFEAFYRSSKDECLRAVLVTTMDADHAEDCTAEAFTRALEHWGRVAAHPSPQAWVVRTATNLHRDRHRRLVRLQRLLPRLAGTEPVEAPDLPIDGTLLLALQGLPRRQREVLALRVLLGLSGQETAQALGISPGSVGVHLHRALGALRSRLPRETRPVWRAITANPHPEALP